MSLKPILIAVAIVQGTVCVCHASLVHGNFSVVPVYTFMNTYFLKSIAVSLLVLLTNTHFCITEILKYYTYHGIGWLKC